MADYDTIQASGQTVRVGSGETYENKLIDVSDGGGFLIIVEGGNSVVRNIGFRGLYTADQFMISITANSGDVLIENIYAGDGANKDGESFTHGPGFMFYHRRSGADVTIRHCNIQGWPNNGCYLSNAHKNGGSATIENCYAKNNGVSSYRVSSPRDRIINSVAYNDDTDYSTDYANWGNYIEHHGRPLWVWSPGGVTIEDSNFAAGSYSGAAYVHGGASIDWGSGTAVSGGGNTETPGGTPDLEPPEGVPMSAEDAASAGDEAGIGDEDGDGDEDEDETIPWRDEYGVMHIYEVENTGGEPVAYYLQVGDDGTFEYIDYDDAIIDADNQWTADDKAAGIVEPGDTHCVGFDEIMIDVTIEPEDRADVRVNEQSSSLGWYPRPDADGDEWKDIDELLGDGDEGEGEDHECECECPDLDEIEVELNEEVVEYLGRRMETLETKLLKLAKAIAATRDDIDLDDFDFVEADDGDGDETDSVDEGFSPMPEEKDDNGNESESGDGGPSYSITKLEDVSISVDLEEIERKQG